MRADIGHELLPDGDQNRQIEQANAATDAHLQIFESALAGLSTNPVDNIDIAALSRALAPIFDGVDPALLRTGDTGMSIQDLTLTAIGWHFARMVQLGRFANEDAAARYLERQLGGVGDETSASAPRGQRDPELAPPRGSGGSGAD